MSNPEKSDSEKAIENKIEEEPKSDPFDIFSQLFEGIIYYVSVIDGKLSRVKSAGIIKYVSSGNQSFYYVYEEEDEELPKKIIPSKRVLEIDLPLESEEFIEEESSDRLDLETRIQVGPDSLGDLEITSSEDLNLFE